MTSEEAEYADGKKLAAWFRTRDLPLIKGGGPTYETFQRRLNRWEQGENASYYVAERFLNLFGYYGWELPEDVWIEKPTSKRGRRKIPAAIRQQALDAIAKGESVASIARRIGVADKTVYVWKHRAAK